MKNRKSTLLAAVAAAALLALGGVSAGAAPAAGTAAAAESGAAPAPRHQRMHGKHMNQEQWQKKRAERAEALRQKLQLTAAQQPAWDAFQQAMQPSRHARLDRADMRKLTTPERIDRMRALREQRAAEADRRGDAVKTFYAALTPEQQKVFDDQRMGPRQGHDGHRFGYPARGAQPGA